MVEVNLYRARGYAHCLADIAVSKPLSDVFAYFLLAFREVVRGKVVIHRLKVVCSHDYKKSIGNCAHDYMDPRIAFKRKGK